MKKYRILFEGDRWPGSDAVATFRALVRAGHFVRDVDVTTIVPEEWDTFTLKLVRRIIFPWCVAEHNKKVLELARHFYPHIFFAFKGTYLLPQTLEKMRGMGITLYNFFPDVSVFSHKHSFLPQTISLYDCVFSAKSFLEKDVNAQGIKLRNFQFVPHGYDPEVHHPVEILPDEKKIYECEVTSIGSWSPKKEELLAALKKRLPDLNLKVWGNGWKNAQPSELRNSIQQRALEGVEYAKGLCGAQIVLALLSEKVRGASSGDLITARTFEIPATGAFMLHERNPEVLQFYEEGKEIECFRGVEELVEKVRYYLNHQEKVRAIAAAGHKRCVPAYSRDQRVAKIIEWHEQWQSRSNMS